MDNYSKNQASNYSKDTTQTIDYIGTKTNSSLLDRTIPFEAEATGRSVIDRSELEGGSMRSASSTVLWRVFEQAQPYPETIAAMERTAEAIARGDADEQVWLLEHPPLYTAGTRASDGDLLDPHFPVHRTGRGGEVTYHGPGQRVAYVMLDLTRRHRDVRAYVASLEHWLIATLERMNVRGERRESRVGVWVQRPERPRLANGQMAEDKVAAIGVRLRRWVTFHGISLNVEPDLSHYEGIVPCGVRDYGVTSLSDLGLPLTMAEADIQLRSAFEDIYGPTLIARPERSS